MLVSLTLDLFIVPPSHSLQFFITLHQFWPLKHGSFNCLTIALLFYVSTVLFFMFSFCLILSCLLYCQLSISLLLTTNITRRDFKKLSACIFADSVFLLRNSALTVSYMSQHYPLSMEADNFTYSFMDLTTTLLLFSGFCNCSSTILTSSLFQFFRFDPRKYPIFIIYWLNLPGAAR